jgi:hypothetical protein
VYRQRILLVIVVLLLAGCAVSPRYKGVAQGGNPNSLGITVDDEWQVTTVDPASPAERAGVEIGDRVLNLTWILSEAPEAVANLGGETPAATNSAPVTLTVTPIRPPAGVEYQTVPFSDTEAIRALISYAVPLRLQIVRGGSIMHLTIIPAPSEQVNGAAQSENHY